MKQSLKPVLALLALLLRISSVRCDPIPDADANSDPELKMARIIPMPYYLSLPKGWTPNKAWPILVNIAGSGHDFRNNCQLFVHARGDRPFIIVTPCLTTDGRDPAETQAVQAIVQEVQQDQHGQSKFFLTGFSAGAHVTWQFIFMHPELLAGAAPAAGGFIGRGISYYSEAPERVELPIHGFQGDKDSTLVYRKQQWANAEQLAHDHGYQNIAFTMIPGAPHMPFAAEVTDFFATLLPK